eukprot:gene12022-14062_t
MASTPTLPQIPTSPLLSLSTIAAVASAVGLNFDSLLLTLSNSNLRNLPTPLAASTAANGLFTSDVNIPLFSISNSTSGLTQSLNKMASLSESFNNSNYFFNFESYQNNMLGNNNNNNNSPPNNTLGMSNQQSQLLGSLAYDLYNNTIQCKWNRCDLKFESLTDFWIHFRTEHFKNKPSVAPATPLRTSGSMATQFNASVTCEWETCGMVIKDFHSLMGHIKFTHLINPYDPDNWRDSVKFDVKSESVRDILQRSQRDGVHDYNTLFAQIAQTVGATSNEMPINMLKDSFSQLQTYESSDLADPLGSDSYDDEDSDDKETASGSKSKSIVKKPRKRRSLAPAGPFACKWGDCHDVMFDTLKDLGEHIAEHIKNQKGKKSESLCEWAGCNRSDKPLKSAYNLIHHVRYKHTGEKPFSCDFPECDSRFVQLSDLNEHKRNIHKVDDGYVKKKRTSKKAEKEAAEAAEKASKAEPLLALPAPPSAVSYTPSGRSNNKKKSSRSSSKTDKEIMEANRDSYIYSTTSSSNTSSSSRPNQHMIMDQDANNNNANMEEVESYQHQQQQQHHQDHIEEIVSDVIDDRMEDIANDVVQDSYPEATSPAFQTPPTLFPESLTQSEQKLFSPLTPFTPSDTAFDAYPESPQISLRSSSSKINVRGNRPLGSTNDIISSESYFSPNSPTPLKLSSSSTPRRMSNGDMRTSNSLFRSPTNNANNNGLSDSTNNKLQLPSIFSSLESISAMPANIMTHQSLSLSNEALNFDLMPMTNAVTSQSHTKKRGKVFGAPLPDNEEIPAIITQTVEYLEAYGLDTSGIFRESGLQAQIHHYKALYEEEKPVVFQPHEAHVVASLLKAYLRELQDPLLSHENYDMMIACESINDEKVKLEVVKKVLKLLPVTNLKILKYLFNFLVKVVAHSETNKMTPETLSIVFLPTILRPKAMTDQEVLQFTVEDSKSTKTLMATILSNYEAIFEDHTLYIKTRQTRAITEFSPSYNSSPMGSHKLAYSPRSPQSSTNTFQHVTPSSSTSTSPFVMTPRSDISSMGASPPALPAIPESPYKQSTPPPPPLATNLPPLPKVPSAANGKPPPPLPVKPPLLFVPAHSLKPKPMPKIPSSNPFEVETRQRSNTTFV